MSPEDGYKEREERKGGERIDLGLNSVKCMQCSYIAEELHSIIIY